MDGGLQLCELLTALEQALIRVNGGLTIRLLRMKEPIRHWDVTEAMIVTNGYRLTSLYRSLKLGKLLLSLAWSVLSNSVRLVIGG